jgi:hypothetical protein
MLQPEVRNCAWSRKYFNQRSETKPALRVKTSVRDQKLGLPSGILQPETSKLGLPSEIHQPEIRNESCPWKDFDLKPETRPALGNTSAMDNKLGKLLKILQPETRSTVLSMDICTVLHLLETRNYADPRKL